MTIRPYLRTKRATAQSPKRPNIVLIMANDIDSANVDSNTHGMMLPTHNLDRLVREVLLFTDHFGGSLLPDDATRQPPASKP